MRESSNTGVIGFVPDGIKHIADYAYMDFLPNYIVISKDVESIGEEVFRQYRNKTIYYKGTEEDWLKISMGSYNYIESIYFYSATKPIDNGNYWHFNDYNEIVIWTRENI